MSDKNPCPCGWRLPSEQDWDKLITFLGGPEEAGDKMKFVSQQYNWGDPNTLDHWYNYSKFSAYPSGGFFNVFAFYSEFVAINSQAFFFSSTLHSDTTVVSYTLYYLQPHIFKYRNRNKDALSMRCIKN
jgi:uncharacterized protein (TIGR02145 family)